MALALLAPAAAHAEWHEASSTHFRVFAEGKPETVRDFATRLERFDKAMRYLNGTADEDLGPANRVTVYVLPNVGAIQKLARGGGDVAGFYIPRAGGSVAFTPRRAGGGSRWDLDAETILLHEYAHHFMLENYATAVFPGWFIEGFAEFNATARFNPDGSVDLGTLALHRAYELALTEAMPVEMLFGSEEGRKASTPGTAMIYGWGWLLTHYLTFEQSRRGQLTAYLNALRSGKTGLEAARAAFGDLRTLDRDLKAYRKRGRFNYHTVPAMALPIGPVTLRPLRPGEAAIMQLRIRSDRGVSLEQAKDLVADMRRAAAPYPDDPAVQAALAEAEYDANNYDAAEAAADRAIAADPANVDALTYRGRVAMARAAGSKDKVEAVVWNEVRRRMLAANKADPNDPAPFILFYDSFRAQGIAPTANAVKGLQRAFELAPQDRMLRMRMARQYLVDGKGAEARAILVPLAFDPHGGAMSEAIQAIVTRIDGDGAAAALSFWDSRGESQTDKDPPPKGKSGAPTAPADPT
jgi:tetratricopeptide (TPR) repeat protein